MASTFFHRKQTNLIKRAFIEEYTINDALMLEESWKPANVFIGEYTISHKRILEEPQKHKMLSWKVQ